MEPTEKIRRLLRRFGLGASEAEVEFYAKLGWQGTIDRLIQDAEGPADWGIDPAVFANRQGTVNLRVVQAIHYARLLTTTQPLTEKIALFWHNHFSVSAMKVSNAFVMQAHIELFRTKGLGPFRELLLAIARDPAMLFFLDNNLNVKGKPNENFAREVMELFTLGIGNYSERDIQEAARAFTGWGFGAAQNGEPARRSIFVFRRDQHDEGMKTVLGKTGNWQGTDVIDHLCGLPQTARFLTEKVWKFFVGGLCPAPVLDALSKQFFDSNLNMATLLRAIMSSDAFYVAPPDYKTPVDFTVATSRAFGAGPIMMRRLQEGIERPQLNEQTGINQALVRALAPAFALVRSTQAMGMELLYPPDVGGWPSGEDWITSASMTARLRWADLLIAGGQGMGRANLGADPRGNSGPSVGADPSSFLPAPGSPSEIVDAMLKLLDAKIAPDRREVLIQAATTQMGSNRLTSVATNTLARRIAGLIFVTPEFQKH